MRFDCIHCRKATTKPQSVKGAFLRMLTKIPVITEFTDSDENDILRETIDNNYRRVKQEIIVLVEPENELIKADPELSRLLNKVD